MTYEFYTDGATSMNGHEGAVGGYAWALIQNDELVSQDSAGVFPATNNICEMKGIISACKKIKENLTSVDRVVIYSDSAYCINCFKQSWYKKWLMNDWLNSKKEPVKNKELWEELIPYFEDEQFDFVKVKGHDENKWNELVDDLAVNARLDYKREREKREVV